MDEDLRFTIAGGGTGGHLYPALAIGAEITNRKPNATVHYVGSKFGLEARVLPSEACRTPSCRSAVCSVPFQRAASDGI